MKIRLLSEKDIRAVSPTLVEIVALVERAYRLDAEGKAEVPTKIGVHPERANTFLQVKTQNKSLGENLRIQMT